MTRQLFLLTYLLPLILINGCRQKAGNEATKENAENQPKTNQVKGTFSYDRDFLNKYKKTVILIAADNSESQVIVVPEYQGRVMTSTANGDSGNSYGWINYKLIESGEHQPHMNGYGGEERFWLSPEGGQFSIYFKKGAAFNFDNWQTPAVIDSEPFDVIASDKHSVQFRKKAVLENASGTSMDITIDRKVLVLDKMEIARSLGITPDPALKTTAYFTENILTNNGPDWQRDKGALGIWLLGMFTPGEKTTIIAPFATEKDGKPALTSDYFGDVPAERLVVKNGVVYLKADGRFRSKIGLAPSSAKPFAGSYDAEKHILTLIQYDLDPKGDYLKSTWETHKDPFKGDALNAYNDGPLADGSQMGPFYELESNSSVKLLKQGEQLKHTQRTYHFEGDTKALDAIAQKTLGVGIDQIVEIFK